MYDILTQPSTHFDSVIRDNQKPNPYVTIASNLGKLNPKPKRPKPSNPKALNPKPLTLKP